MKRKIKALQLIGAAVFSVALCMLSACALPPRKPQETPDGAEDDGGEAVRVENIGAGGYGAIFDAQIDPFNPSVFAARCDMGCVYVSENKGESWTRHEIRGTLYSLKFDPTTEGVLWAAGSGLYKSVDHGKSFEMVYPDPQTVTSADNQLENVNHWIYSTSDYVAEYQLKSIAINRKNGNNVFVAQKINGAMRIHKTENGRDFSKFVDIQDGTERIRLEYDEQHDYLVAATDDKIIALDQAGNTVYTHNISVERQVGNVLAFSSYYDKNSGKTTFAFSTAKASEHAADALYVTDDLEHENTFTDLIPSLVAKKLSDIKELADQQEESYASYEYIEWIGGKRVKHEFKWGAKNVFIVRPGCLYFYVEDKVPYHDMNGDPTGGARNVNGYCKYEDGAFKWIYGGPHRFYHILKNGSWQDSDLSGCGFGLSALPENDDAFLFSTIGSVYYTEDGDNIYQKHCTPTEEITLSVKNGGSGASTIKATPTVTSGFNVQTTYKTQIDPFDSNHLLMACTDIGLIQSLDGGNSWMRCLTAWDGDSTKKISENLRNTCYDIHFDRERQGVVYALWSGRHNMPYAPQASDLNEKGMFGTSYDGGTSWVFTSIRADDKVLPYRMCVEYEGDARTIYVAAMGQGFFVSKDAGQTFTEMNAGITPSNYFGADKPAIFGNEILSCKGGIYALTASAAKTYDRALYKWNESAQAFEEIPLPQKIACVRDIEYSEQEDCLYLAAIARRKNYQQMDMEGGGVYRYKNGEFTEVFDESKNVWGVALDSTGRLYAVLQRGEIYRYTENNTQAVLLKDGLFHMLKDIAFGASDNELFVSTLGGGMYRITLNPDKL